MNINKRISTVCELKKIRQSYLVSEGLGSKQTISFIFNKKQKPNTEFIEKFLNIFPDLNARWLMSGNGDMFLKTDNRDTVIHGGTNVITETANKVVSKVNYDQSNSKLTQKVSELENVIENLQKEKELIETDNQRLKEHIERLEKFLDKK